MPEQLSLLAPQPRRVCFFAVEGATSRHPGATDLDLAWSVCPGETVEEAREVLWARGVRPVRVLHPAGARDDHDEIDQANLAAAGWRAAEEV